MVGLSQLVSSRVPPIIRAMPGKPSASITTIDPQRGQNLRFNLRPLSPAFVNDWSLPCTEKFSFGTATTSTNAEPVCFWQSRHWQIEVTAGSPDAEYRTSPQRHPPFILGICSSSRISNWVRYGRSGHPVRACLNLLLGGGHWQH